MSNAKVVDGNKVLIELEWEQIDAIMVNELREHILSIHKEWTRDDYFHPDDRAHQERLLPALYVVYEYWAGEAEANKLKKETGYED